MTTPEDVQITGDNGERYDEVLTAPALAFLADLHRSFDARRLELLQARSDRYEELAAGGMLDFLPETQEIRDGGWQVAPAAPGLVDRRAEITGPTDRKMTINALNSGAKVWLADMEDASTPAWANVVEGQLNLRDALDRTIDFTSPEGKSYVLGQDLATIVVRPRGWHLPEKHIIVNGAPMSGALVDFGLYFFTAPSARSTRARARTSIFPSWRATSRHGSGTTCSSVHRNASASRWGRFAPRS